MLQLKEAEIAIESREVKIRELQTLLETSRDNESRLSDVVQTMRTRVRELEDQLASYQTVSDRGEYTISSMQQELRESNDKVVELEARLRLKSFNILLRYYNVRRSGSVACFLRI